MWTRSEHFTSLSASFVLLGLEYIGKPFQGAEDFFCNVSVDTRVRTCVEVTVLLFLPHRVIMPCAIYFNFLQGRWMVDWRHSGCMKPNETTGSCLQRGKDISWHVVRVPRCCAAFAQAGLETATIRGITRTSLQAQCVGLPGFTGFRHI